MERKAITEGETPDCAVGISTAIRAHCAAIET
jgi:hypothetical protein